ncbi:septal ring lytic transglycosylase RlpA family protein [Lewinella sp. LCG006]|uniref:septal ring lytic transglycosylase RlpA family protein n=1 Tax=Lewinella sp. LCG006 TaxID=3231911 RepID=UPI00345F25B2
MRTILLLTLVLTGLTISAQTFRWNTPQEEQAPANNDPLIDETGYALFYADYLEGNATALGEIYRHNLMTAGHPKLPLGTIVKVTRLDNGLSTTVRINDRGAYCDDCIIDLSRAAAQQIDMIRVGRTKVNLTVMGFSNNNPPTPANYQAPAAANQLAARTPATEYYYSPPVEKPQDFQTAKGVESTYTRTYRQTNTFGHDQIIRTIPVQATPSGYDGMGNPINPTNQHDNRPALVTKSGTSPVVSNGQVEILTTAISPYAVQLASYGEFTNAERHVMALQAKGFNSIFVMQQQRPDGGIINRVIVAPFNSATDAHNYLAELRQYHQMEGLVVTMK